MLQNKEDHLIKLYNKQDIDQPILIQKIQKNNEKINI